jgi:hypothetical protein
MLDAERFFVPEEIDLPTGVAETEFFVLFRVCSEQEHVPAQTRSSAFALHVIVEVLLGDVAKSMVAEVARNGD